VAVVVAAAVECADGSFDRAGGSSRDACHRRALDAHGSSRVAVTGLWVYAPDYKSHVDDCTRG